MNTSPLNPVRENMAAIGLQTDVPIFFLHAEMLHKVRHGIEKIGGMDGYDADLMEQSIRVLQSIKKKDCCYSL